MNYSETRAFANALSTLEGLDLVYSSVGEKLLWDPDANGYRLPTEAEWEYAARADGDTVYPGGDDPETLCWADDNADGVAHLVGRLDPNGWGLLDMCGNLREWVHDRRGYWTDEPLVDPEGPLSGLDLWSVRGGGWIDRPGVLRVADRSWDTPNSRSTWIGLRLVRTISD